MKTFNMVLTTLIYILVSFRITLKLQFPLTVTGLCVSTITFHFKISDLPGEHYHATLVSHL